MNIETYIDLHQPTDKITCHSATYGPYYMRKIGTVNMLKALDGQKLKECADAWSKLMEAIFNCYHTKTINFRKVSEYQNIEDFDLYISFAEDNKDWTDPNKYLKKFPLGLTENRFNKILNKLTKLNIG